MVISSADVLLSARVHMRGAFEWGSRDCLTSSLRVFADLTGLVVSTPRYRSYGQAARILRRAGGYEAWCRRAFRGLGEGVLCGGALCLLSAPSRPFAAILGVCIRPGEYAAKGQSGMYVLRADLLRCWLCPLS